EAGFKEIVLGGVNLGLYRDGIKDLSDVVIALSEIEALKMIRISSIEPQLLNGDLLGRLGGITKLCPHFHIPLQSGSDTILQRMGRHYDTALIRGLVSDILSSFPHAAIGFDVITGFPGESEELFEENRAFLISLPIAYLHVFAYSRRKGTPADKMPGQVANMEKNRRSKILGTLSEAKKQQYRDLLLTNDVKLCGIIESENEMLSDHYLRVKLPFKAKQGDYISIKASQLGFILQVPPH
ncbi:MAG TPA: tRNA (N(6)-L-threonylcarbamoyladenosine(37)-C(2))-methylthiotransferase MtaB, partial [Candidatus Cloacimonadota bacterium]|nr:tRNA (N(6)-L-threonylcarbamoyladenosine(37)-C(2))-methylthiotransferase MtaB [Candidatus Cloacimonadota bacterium]